MTEFSSLQILQSGCNPRHLNSRAFLDCSGLHLDYMDYMVIKWIAEQGNPKQSKGNLCNPSAIHCNIGLQFGFAIQSNLCNPTAMQEDCSLIVEIAVWLLRLQKFRNLHIQLVNPTACRWLQSPQSNCNLHNPTAICAIQLQSQQSNCNLHNPTHNQTAKVPRLTYTVGHPTACR